MRESIIKTPLLLLSRPVFSFTLNISNAIRILSAVVLVIASNALSYSQTAVYVSPSGKDSYPGTFRKPYASIERARAEARQNKHILNIYLKQGTYYLHAPVIFTAEDSRYDNAPLAIRAVSGEKVKVSGAVLLKLKWSSFKNGIWQARVERDMYFDQLFVNGKLQRMARYPNYNPK